MNSFPQTTWREAALKDISALRKVILWFLMPPTVLENNDPRFCSLLKNMVTDIIAKNKDGGAGERSVLEISWCHAWGSFGAQAGRPPEIP